ncbi:MurR/RpiR family transcriptional regulator [Bifidobacterium amazonense]|uniref:MurR/RpiR family transcriptional regulator n=1 Tax=Bifidobacterium amazonense TaxID=2809027 RepID=A0ABS9VWT0_9BIFI|nr:MurR/RpiR family transcriptional regulator [Bifidobacterium amazonense]MCH9276573.1 MurR/RpiR family transcriptional regulator [Bifidobacterium amazonense]
MEAERNYSDLVDHGPESTARDAADASDAADAAVGHRDDPSGALDRIRRSFPSLTATEQEAARFILGHLTDVMICTSAELAELSGVSQPTMSRLYRKLGYANAGEFRRDIRRVHQPGAPEIGNMDEHDGDMVGEHLRRDLDSLTRTFSRLGESDVLHAAASLRDARRVGVVGFRNGYPAALHLREQLVQLRGDVHVLPEPGQSVAEELVDYGPDDAVVLIGVRRRPELFARVAASLAAAHVPTIVIGDATVRTLPECADATVFEADLSTRVLSSYTAVFAVVSLLVDAVSDLVGAAGAERIASINDRFRELGELER